MPTEGGGVPVGYSAADGPRQAPSILARRPQELHDRLGNGSLMEGGGQLGLPSRPKRRMQEASAILLDGLREVLAGMDWSTASVELSIFNGQHFLRMGALINRMRDEARDVERILGFVAEHLPGSYDLLYERAADMPVPPGQNAFRVRNLPGGVL